MISFEKIKEAVDMVAVLGATMTSVMVSKMMVSMGPALHLYLVLAMRAR